MNLPPLPLLDPLSVGDEEMGFTTVRAQQASLPKWGLRHMPHRAVDCWPRLFGRPTAHLDGRGEQGVVGREGGGGWGGATRAKVRQRYASWGSKSRNQDTALVRQESQKNKKTV
ncbi:hypothetical protein LA080_007959 [Diaporthe eres]|nr:hypothetical protein LA080_007959 [Diaporthe eres]